MSARSRTTPYAVLGMLSFGPMSGYDIRKEAASSIGYFWSESYGQLYPALRDLAAAGLIRRPARPPAGRRDRQVYEITDRGKEALRVWRTEPPRTGPIRSELLLKLFFGDRSSVAPEIAWIESLVAAESAALRDYRRIRRQLWKEQSDHPSLPFWLITLSYGEHHSRAILRWCKETRNTLRSMQGAEKPKDGDP